jgi:hypothetical protein
MNRRSILRIFGLAPVAAVVPAATTAFTENVARVHIKSCFQWKQVFVFFARARHLERLVVSCVYQ